MSIAPTQITVRPAADVYGEHFPSSAKRLAGERYTFPTADAQARLFGEGGFSLRDVVDTINPLRHIPVISSLYDQATGTQASAASKLVGGALLGGPLGFLAGLADVIFEQQTGHSAAGAVYAALTQSPAPASQVAQVAAPATTSASAAAPQQVASAATDADGATLALFGQDTASAHASYRNAQFRPYLSDVSTSHLL